jgi:hypothetical protein
MLIGALGVRLILWAGPTIPLPAPPGVMKALTRLTVTNDSQGQDGFQFTLTLGKTLLGDFGTISDGTFDPMRRVVIAVLMGATPEVLVDGLVTHLQVAPSGEPGQSTMTVTGKDVSQAMDLAERNTDYPNQPDAVIVSRLVEGYPQYGLVPNPTPTTDVPIMVQRIPRQQETDLHYIRRLARRNGYVFYVEPVGFGVNRAYFGPETRVGQPQPALTQGLGPAANVTSLSFTNDALAPVGTHGTFVDPVFKLPIPIPTLPSLRLPPLSRSPATAYRTVQLRDTAKENPGRAATAAVAAVTDAPEAIEGTGELDGARYGSVLRARRLVGVRGAGTSSDGFYWVKRVTHTITPGGYTQSFSLSRDGTGALLPAVVP